MKLLFVNDHIFLKIQGKLYSDKFSYDILSRYLKLIVQILDIKIIKK